ncbi:MAG: hypothetical protein HFI64_12275 [Lachnospiraceae bacterium]|nr:hypothetical protein [Lachnospiraceae bacterium]
MSGSGTKRWVIGVVALIVIALAAAAYLMSRRPAERADKGTLVRRAADGLQTAGEAAGDGLRAAGEMAEGGLEKAGEMAEGGLRTAGRLAGDGMRTMGARVKDAAQSVGECL